MNITLSDRRHPYLLNAKGETLLPGRVLHDRRRRRVVEELLDAMRIRAHTAERQQELRDQAKRHASIRRRFWLALAIMVIASFFVALVARWADHSSEGTNFLLGVQAIYEWLGFHRVAPIVP